MFKEIIWGSDGSEHADGAPRLRLGAFGGGPSSVDHRRAREGDHHGPRWAEDPNAQVDEEEIEAEDRGQVKD